VVVVASFSKNKSNASLNVKVSSSDEDDDSAPFTPTAKLNVPLELKKDMILGWP
jgi:hypothetical protein